MENDLISKQQWLLWTQSPNGYSTANNEFARKIVPTHIPKNSRRNYSNYTHPIFYLKVDTEIKVAQEAVIQKR